MALVQINNGDSGTAQTVDQFRQLLTGIMADQPVKLLPNLTLKAISAPPGAPTVAVAAGGSVDVGAHTYAVTFLTSDGGETKAGTTVVATTTSGNQTVNLSAIPTGPTGVTQRNVYRSKAGTTTPLFLVHTLADNTTTTYSDGVADSTLPATQPPSHGSVGGSLTIQDTTGAAKARIYNDGAVSFDNGAITSDGAGGLTVASINTGGGSLTVTSWSASAASYVTLSANGEGIGVNGPGGYSHLGTASTGGTLVSNNAMVVIVGGSSYFGVKLNNGTKLFEVKNDGSFTCNSNTMHYTSGSFTWVAGTNFDAYDVAESFPVDRPYDNGTVVCPDHNHVMSRCQHEACEHAAVVSTKPAMKVGMLDEEDPDNLVQYVAVAGRVLCGTADDIAPRSYVCSDGDGGVRAFRPGESGLALGYTLGEPAGGFVGVLLRPMMYRA